MLCSVNRVGEIYVGERETKGNQSFRKMFALQTTSTSLRLLSKTPEDEQRKTSLNSSQQLSSPQWSEIENSIQELYGKNQNGFLKVSKLINSLLFLLWFMKFEKNAQVFFKLYESLVKQSSIYETRHLYLIWFVGVESMCYLFIFKNAKSFFSNFWMTKRHPIWLEVAANSW